jgi:hypothetical protein
LAEWADEIAKVTPLAAPPGRKPTGTPPAEPVPPNGRSAEISEIPVSKELAQDPDACAAQIGAIVEPLRHGRSRVGSIVVTANIEMDAVRQVLAITRRAVREVSGQALSPRHPECPAGWRACRYQG